MEQFKIALILVVCGLCATFVAGDDCSDGVAGYFPNPSDPAKYFQCWDGQRYDFMCPDKLVFFKYPYMCWPAEGIASYIKNYISASPNMWPITGPEPVEGAIPITADCPNGNSYTAIEGVCDKYYSCWSGIRNLMDCYGNKYISGPYCSMDKC